LDEHAILEALPALEEPRLTHGRTTPIAARRKEKDTAIVGLAKELKKGVTYGYADATGDYVSRERFDDPDPPSIDDLDAWMAQRPSAVMALEVAKSIAASGDREAARRWVEKARRESLPTAKIEAVIREAFAAPSGAPPLRKTPERIELDVDALSRDPRWEPIAELVRGLAIEGEPAIEERLRVLSRET